MLKYPFCSLFFHLRLICAGLRCQWVQGQREAIRCKCVCVRFFMTSWLIYKDKVIFSNICRTGMQSQTCPLCLSCPPPGCHVLSLVKPVLSDARPDLTSSVFVHALIPITELLSCFVEISQPPASVLADCADPVDNTSSGLC